jgi:hypothetical protein
MSTGHGVATAMPEQPTNIATTCAPESSSGSLHDLPSERSNSVVCLLCNQMILYFMFTRVSLPLIFVFSTSVKMKKILVEI